MAEHKLSMSDVKALAAAVAKEEECPELEQFLLDYMKLRYASDPEKRKSLKLPTDFNKIKPKTPWDTINTTTEAASIHSPKQGGRWGYLHVVLGLPSTVSQTALLEFAAKLRPGEQSALLNFINGHHVSYEAYKHGITVHEAQALLDSALYILVMKFKRKRDLLDGHRPDGEPLLEYASSEFCLEARRGRSAFRSHCLLPRTCYLVGVNDRTAFPSTAHYLDFDNILFYFHTSISG